MLMLGDRLKRWSDRAGLRPKQEEIGAVCYGIREGGREVVCEWCWCKKMSPQCLLFIPIFMAQLGESSTLDPCSQKFIFHFHATSWLWLYGELEWLKEERLWPWWRLYTSWKDSILMQVLGSRSLLVFCVYGPKKKERIGMIVGWLG